MAASEFDYGSIKDLLARICTIERAVAGTARPLPVAGFAGSRTEIADAEPSLKTNMAGTSGRATPLH